MRETGVYQKIGTVNYFIPSCLPPANPSFAVSAEMLSLYGEAILAVTQLNEISKKLPDQKRFMRAYVIKEAMLSSQIEGIHTTLMDVLTMPLSGQKPTKDTQLVLNYIDALNAALKMMQNDGIPLTIRVLLRAHEVLMSGGEGEKASPGQFRKQSVRVGNLIPPPAHEIMNLMSDLEKYINTDSEIPPLIRAGLAHVQFETIHPFLDGNGRIGRLLIVLMLVESGLLAAPILYPSYFFKKHHSEYYRKLDSVRTEGDFEGWTMYYLQAIRDSARDAYLRAQEIEQLAITLKQMIMTDSSFVKTRDNATLVLEALFEQPVTSVSTLSNQLGKAYNTVHNILQEFIKQGIVAEITLNKRNRLYQFKEYLVLLEKEYD